MKDIIKIETQGCVLVCVLCVCSCTLCAVYFESSTDKMWRDSTPLMSLLGKKNFESMLLSGHRATQNQIQLSDPNSTKTRQKKESKVFSQESRPVRIKFNT